MNDKIDVTPEIKIMINKLDAECLIAEANLIQAQMNRFNYLREQGLTENNNE